MKPAPFRHCTVATVEEALDALREHGSDAKVLAGGQSLVPLMNLRLSRPAVLVDINRIEALSGVTVGDGTVVLGARTRHRVVERSAGLAAAVPMLREATALIGHDAIRTRGTFGGSVAHADPAAELPAALVALDATIEARSSRGLRTIPAAEFFAGFLTTALADDELLTGVSVPVIGPRTGHAFVELARRHGDFAIVGVAASVSLDATGRLGSVHIGLGGVDVVPVRAHGAERVLSGCEPSRAAFEAAGEEAARDLTPPGDGNGTPAYRKALVRTLVPRALAIAQTRAQMAARGAS